MPADAPPRRPADTDADAGADPYDLQRFLDAQAGIYPRALAEIRDGRKRSHWMWFIFPQLAGLGSSGTARRYAITSRDEARAYLAHPVLGPRLVESAEAALSVTNRSAHAIFGSPDDLKLRSCATLFASVAAEAEAEANAVPASVFHRLLDRYYDGEPDPRTLDLLAEADSA